MNNKITKIRTIFIFLLFGIVMSMLLPSCIELIGLEGLEGLEAVEGMEGLSATEAGALGAEADILAEEGLSLRAATGEVVVADETTFYGELSRVKVEPGGTRLSIMRNGRQLNIGEIESENSIRLKNINRPLELPGKIYKTSANVNVRAGGGLNYKVFKTITKDRIVLVLDEQNGWCKVEIGKGEVGWMYATYLIAASNKHKDSKNTNNEISNKNVSNPTKSNSTNTDNQIKKYTPAKSDSVRLFFRYKNTNQQQASLDNSSPMINQTYFNNNWHTCLYYPPTVKRNHQPYIQPQIIQRYSSHNANTTVQTRQSNTHQLRKNQSANMPQNNSRHSNAVSTHIVHPRSTPSQNYSSNNLRRASNQRQNSPNSISNNNSTHRYVPTPQTVTHQQIQKQNYPTQNTYRNSNQRQMSVPKQHYQPSMNIPRNNIPPRGNSVQQYNRQVNGRGRTNSPPPNVRGIRR